MKITKKKLIRLIRESINEPKNPDNTLEKIFLREVHYRLNYLTSFIDQFDFLIQQTAIACNDYDDDLSDKIEKLRSDYDNGYGDRLKLNSQIEILSEIKEKVTRPCTRSCGSLRGATEYFGIFFGYIYDYLIFESANNLGLKKDSASFEFANSGKNDGKEDLISIIKNNYNSSNTEKIDIIQYIIDTWNDKEWIIGNMDPEAKSVLETNGISNISTYDKIDTLIILLKDAGIIGQKMQDQCFERTGVKSLETQLLNDLNKIDGQIKNKLPNHKAKYENDIEEFLYILREERNYSFKNIMNIITDSDQTSDSDDHLFLTLHKYLDY